MASGTVIEEGDVVDMAEVAADDAFLDTLARADAETLTMLCEVGGPLLAPLAAWALTADPEND